jgi:uncharacterized protein
MRSVWVHRAIDAAVGPLGGLVFAAGKGRHAALGRRLGRRSARLRSMVGVRDARAADLIVRAEEYVREQSAGESSGHDWWHVQRVRSLGLRLAREEGADELIVQLAALLHDIADYKFSGSHEANVRAVEDWLQAEGADAGVIAAVAEIVAGVSFMGAGVADAPLSIEGLCVRDADRLDAIGAIGIARAFAYGGHTGRPLHDPTTEPRAHANLEEYVSAEGTTINHFYEKLLLLRGRMSTSSGRRIAEHRHAVMRSYLDEFDKEWDGADGG